ncbi:MAG: Na+/H+ antiporter NhaA [Acidimicrobiales bacterium]
MAAVLLAGALIAALVWANLANGSSMAFWGFEVHVEGLPRSFFGSVRGLIDNGLMAVFFLAVGLEVGRERAHGSLRTHRQAILPVLAALGGMAGAAGAYLATVVLAGGGATLQKGWGIPMATDVAFTLVALALLGRRVPPGLRAFVLALAVADDVASVIILALVAHSSLHAWALVGSIAVLAGTAVMRRWVPRQWWPYVVAAIATCAMFAWAGVEPPLGAAFVGILVPHASPASLAARVGLEGRAIPRPGAGQLLERVVAPVSTLVIVPIFVLANAGLTLDWHRLAGSAALSVVVGIVMARVVGKAAGIALATFAVVRSGASPLPDGSRWVHLIGAASLCGIGFTVPLLFATAVFAGHPILFAASQAGLLAGTLLALVIGGVLLIAADRLSRRAAAIR